LSAAALVIDNSLLVPYKPTIRSFNDSRSLAL
jgi:hypothetical protein